MPNTPASFYGDILSNRSIAAADEIARARGIALGTEAYRDLYDQVDAANTGLETGGNFERPRPVAPGTKYKGEIDAFNNTSYGFNLGADLLEAFAGIGIGTEAGFQSTIITLRGIGKKFRDAALKLLGFGDPKPSTLPADTFGRRLNDHDPLILDLDGGGVSLTSLGLSNAYFDLNSNGFAERTGWVRAGDGLLALDVNGNGRIDNGSELFGTATQNGFAVLARYDDNRDGRITSADAVWSSLLVWRDNNADGVSAASELSAAAANDIGGIGAEAIAVA